VAELDDPAGRLELDSVLTVRFPTVRGGALTRAAEIRWESHAEGLTIDELWARLVDPLRVLLSLAVDADSPAVAVEVRDRDDDPWLELIHPGIEPASEDLLPGHEILLTREHLGLSEVSQWLSRAGGLSPLPQLVAGVAVASSARTVQNQLLELAAAAEGLHRRLYPNERAMNADLAKQARRDASNVVLEQVRPRVSQALLHLAEPTFRERLEALLDRGREATPGIPADRGEWTSRIVAARNGFAHQLSPRGGSALEFEEHFVLLQSLRWLLTSLLLLEAGVHPGTIATRLRQHQPYLHLGRQARRWMPSVFPSDTTTAHTEA
jgi:hypothetical protein